MKFLRKLRISTCLQSILGLPDLFFFLARKQSRKRLGRNMDCWLGEDPAPSICQVIHLKPAICPKALHVWYVSMKPQAQCLRLTDLENRLMVKTPPYHQTIQSLNPWKQEKFCFMMAMTPLTLPFLVPSSPTVIVALTLVSHSANSCTSTKSSCLVSSAVPEGDPLRFWEYWRIQSPYRTSP